MARVIGPGPSTSESKTWQGELTEAILLALSIWIAMCLMWGGLLLFVWMVKPEAGLVRWFRTEPLQWASVFVALAFPCLLWFLMWARQELFDSDYTSLHGKNELSGIVPVVPWLRAVFIAKWLFGKREPGKGTPFAEFMMRMGRGGEDEQDQ